MQTEIQSTQAKELISASRLAQKMTLREFGAALGVSHAMVDLWEKGVSVPDRSRIASWIADERQWVRLLGLQIFGAQYRALIQNVLVPA